jgi:hypothetical protein
MLHSGVFDDRDDELDLTPGGRHLAVAEWVGVLVALAGLAAAALVLLAR